MAQVQFIYKRNNVFLNILSHTKKENDALKDKIQWGEKKKNVTKKAKSIFFVHAQLREAAPSFSQWYINLLLR